MSFITYLTTRSKSKNFFSALFVLGTMILFSGCEKEKNDTYYYVIGNMQMTSDSILIISDANEHLLITNWPGVANIKDNDRVYAYFTIREKRTASDSLIIINLYSINKILTKPVFVLTPATVDSIGNDPLKVHSLWITKNYLNLEFSYFGYNQTHYINLTRQEGNIPTDTINLEIMHNSHNDSQVAEMEALVSFDITSLQNTLKDSVILHITAKEYDDRIYEKYMTYKY